MSGSGWLAQAWPWAFARPGGETALGGRPASRAGQYAWAFFDWANQPYFTIVAGFVFVPYFTTHFVGDPVRGQEILGYIAGAAGIAIALMSPVMGAIADAAGRRKPWIFAFSAIFVFAAWAHWFAPPGAPDGVGFIVGAMILSGITMEMATVFNNAMLPGIAPKERIGFLSGFGFGIGYVGGLVAIVLVLLAFAWPADGVFPWGAPVPWKPLLGVDPAAFEQDRIIGPLSAIWYVLFVTPMFLFTPEDLRARRAPLEAVRTGLKQLGRTFAEAGRYRNVGLFLLGRMIYNDGLNAVFTFGPAYAVAVFGWTGATSAVFGLMLLVTASVAAFVGGIIDDRIGAKRTLQLAVICLFAGTALALSITGDRVLFVVPVEPGIPGEPFSGVSEWLYLLAGTFIGLGAGPAQSASRSLMARLSPPGMVTEFFGLYAFSGKATAFVAPLLIGLLTGFFGAQQPALLIILAFFVVGFVLLLFVREERDV